MMAFSVAVCGVWSACCGTRCGNTSFHRSCWRCFIVHFCCGSGDRISFSQQLLQLVHFCRFFFQQPADTRQKSLSTNSKCGGNRNYESNFSITIIAYVELHLAYSESVRFHKYAHENMQQYRRKRQKATIRTQWCKTTHLHIYMSCHANNTRDETLFTTFIYSNLQLRWCLPCIYVHF